MPFLANYAFAKNRIFEPGFLNYKKAYWSSLICSFFLQRRLSVQQFSGRHRRTRWSRNLSVGYGTTGMHFLHIVIVTFFFRYFSG